MISPNDKMILELPGHQLIQHFMEDDRVQRIKIYQPQLKGNFKVEVISEKGKTTLIDLQAREWQVLTHRPLLDSDQDFPSRPLLLRSHSFAIKSQENGYTLSLVAKALVAGGNGSSRPGTERFVGLDWKERINLELQQIPTLQDSPVPLTSDQQRQLDLKLLKAVKAKSYAKVLKFLNQGANPNNYVVTVLDGESRRQSVFFEAIHRQCPVSIVNLLAARFHRHQNQYGEPALAALLEAGELYLSTMQLLLNKGESPDANYSIKTFGSKANDGYNVYIMALLKKNFKIMQLLIETPGFNPNKKYMSGTLFLETFTSGRNHQESMIFEALTKLMIEQRPLILMDIDDLDNPLIQSALQGWADVGKLLLEKGMNPNARKAPQDMNALQLAISSDCEELARTLIMYGADVNSCAYKPRLEEQIEHFDPLIEAQERGWTEVADLIAQRRGTGMIVPTVPMGQIPMAQMSYAPVDGYSTQLGTSQGSSSSSIVSQGSSTADTNSQVSSSTSSAESSPTKQQQPISWQQPGTTSAAPQYAMNGMQPYQMNGMQSAQANVGQSQPMVNPQQYAMNPAQPYAMNGAQQNNYAAMMTSATHDIY